MKKIPLCLIGFGNVGQAFARMLLRKKDALEKDFQVNFFVTAISTGRHGTAINRDGIDLEKALSLSGKDSPLQELSKSPSNLSPSEIIEQSKAEVMLENTPVNYSSGQPALDHISTALKAGMHAITANKGAVLHGYHQLTKLALTQHRQFLFESTVMDGAPIFSLVRKTLPAIDFYGFEGILNSCTNLLLERMEAGQALDDAVNYARSVGITETDPSGDIDGWDAAIKVTLLVNILMNFPIKLDEVKRKGIRAIQLKDIQSAIKEGCKWKLVCRAERKNGKVIASVSPEKVFSKSPLYNVSGTSSFILFKTDSLPGLGILESNPGPETTAYGLLSDLLSIYSEREN
jgi:homoserine dehydrogenase